MYELHFVWKQIRRELQVTHGWLKPRVLLEKTGVPAAELLNEEIAQKKRVEEKKEAVKVYEQFLKKFYGKPGGQAPIVSAQKDKKEEKDKPNTFNKDLKELGIAKPKGVSWKRPENENTRSSQNQNSASKQNQLSSKQFKEDLSQSPEALIKKLEGLVKIQALIRGFLVRKNSYFKVSQSLKNSFGQRNLKPPLIKSNQGTQSQTRIGGGAGSNQHLNSILKKNIASSSHSVASPKNEGRPTVDRKGKSLLKLPSQEYQDNSSMASGDVAGQVVKDHDTENQSVFGNFQMNDPTQEWRTYFQDKELENAFQKVEIEKEDISEEGSSIGSASDVSGDNIEEEKLYQIAYGVKDDQIIKEKEKKTQLFSKLLANEKAVSGPQMFKALVSKKAPNLLDTKQKGSFKLGVRRGTLTKNQNKSQMNSMPSSFIVRHGGGKRNQGGNMKSTKEEQSLNENFDSSHDTSGREESPYKFGQQYSNQNLRLNEPNSGTDPRQGSNRKRSPSFNDEIGSGLDYHIYATNGNQNKNNARSNDIRGQNGQQRPTTQQVNRNEDGKNTQNNANQQYQQGANQQIRLMNFNYKTTNVSKRENINQVIKDTFFIKKCGVSGVRKSSGQHAQFSEIKGNKQKGESKLDQFGQPIKTKKQKKNKKAKRPQSPSMEVQTIFQQQNGRANDMRERERQNFKVIQNQLQKPPSNMNIFGPPQSQIKLAAGSDGKNQVMRQKRQAPQQQNDNQREHQAYAQIIMNNNKSGEQSVQYIPLNKEQIEAMRNGQKVVLPMMSEGVKNQEIMQSSKQSLKPNVPGSAPVQKSGQKQQQFLVLRSRAAADQIANQKTNNTSNMNHTQNFDSNSKAPQAHKKFTSEEIEASPMLKRGKRQGRTQDRNRNKLQYQADPMYATAGAHRDNNSNIDQNLSGNEVLTDSSMPQRDLKIRKIQAPKTNQLQATNQIQNSEEPQTRRLNSQGGIPKVGRNGKINLPVINNFASEKDLNSNKTSVQNQNPGNPPSESSQGNNGQKAPLQQTTSPKYVLQRQLGQTNDATRFASNPNSLHPNENTIDSQGRYLSQTDQKNQQSQSGFRNYRLNKNTPQNKAKRSAEFQIKDGEQIQRALPTQTSQLGGRAHGSKMVVSSDPNSSFQKLASTTDPNLIQQFSAAQRTMQGNRPDGLTQVRNAVRNSGMASGLTSQSDQQKSGIKEIKEMKQTGPPMHTQNNAHYLVQKTVSPHEQLKQSRNAQGNIANRQIIVSQQRPAGSTANRPPRAKDNDGQVRASTASANHARVRSMKQAFWQVQQPTLMSSVQSN